MLSIHHTKEFVIKNFSLSIESANLTQFCFFFFSFWETIVQALVSSTRTLSVTATMAVPGILYNIPTHEFFFFLNLLSQISLHASRTLNITVCVRLCDRILNKYNVRGKGFILVHSSTGWTIMTRKKKK